MFRLTLSGLLALGCVHTGPTRPLTAAEHDQLAAHYEATARSIEWECGKARRHEYSVEDPQMCWKANDKRFLDANLHAAERHRTAANALRAQAQPAG
jgi:hypothetical protein